MSGTMETRDQAAVNERNRLALLSIIEDEKLAKQRLAEAASRWQGTFDAISDIVCVISSEHEFLAINKSGLSSLGLPIGEVVGRRCYELVHRMDSPIAQCPCAAMLDSGKPEQSEHEIDGRYLLLQVWPIRDPDGVIRSFVHVIKDITGQKRAERALRELSGRQEALLAAIPVIVMEVDTRKVYTWANQAGKEFFGEDVIGKEAVHYFVGEQRTYDDVAPLFEGADDIICVESWQRRRDGQKRLLAWRCRSLKNDNGEVIGALSSAQDITEQRQAEHALLESERNLQAAQRIGEMGSWEWDIADNKLTWTDELYRIWGLDTGMNLSYDLIEGMILAEDRALNKAKVESLLQGGEGGEYQLRIVRPDGDVRFIRQVIEPRRGADGSVIAAVGVMQDITRHELAERALKASDSKYRSMVESINDVIFSINTDGIVTYISPAIERFMKYTVNEIVGQPFAMFIHPDDLEDLTASFRRNLAGQIEPSIYRTVDKDGSIKYVHSTSHSMVEDGAVMGITGTLTDYTQQRKMEVEKELVEDELRQSQKMEAVGQLAGGVAHDFNNMLAGIMGNAELLYMKLAGNQEQIGLVEQILKAGEHAANLTKQLLSFARRGQYQLTAIDVHRSIGNVAGILANTIDRRIRIKQSLRARPSTVMGDPTQIENALMNLALNARDAMPEGGDLIFSTDVVEFDATYVAQHKYKIDPGQYLMVSVSDTGSGMSEEVRDHIFEPFFTTKGPGKGTGLGLASVYGIAKNHKGSIECYSEPGHGTVMKVYLPLAANEAQQQPARLVAEIQPGTGSILLVDDEHMIREMAGQMLRGLGYRVHTCQDGQEAVEHFQQHYADIDLVILDMIMPRLNGREAFLKMREIDPGVRALLASGFSADGEAQEVLKLGIRGFVQKPFRMAELSARIRGALADDAAPERSTS